MKTILFSYILFMLICLESKGQSCISPCPYYASFIKMAQADTVKNTQAKLNYYRAAIVAAKDCNCPQLEQNANEAIDALFVKIEAEKQLAESQAQLIIEQQKEVNLALENAERANEKNIRIIEAMDFYDGKFALALKNGKYGFIDKNGNSTLDFDYDRGSPFDPYTGFAEMEIVPEYTKNGTKYLIDTMGNRYQLFDINEDDMIRLRKESTKNKKQKTKQPELGEELDLTTLNKELYYRFTKNKEKIALNFKNLKKHNALLILKYLAEDVNTKDRVEVLTWEDNELTVFPDVITTFENLNNIDISNTSIKSIPTNIEGLKNLKKIELPCSVEKLPSSIYNLEYLETLNLFCIELTELPESIGDLKNLKVLKLPYTLEIFPVSIGNLANLEILDLDIMDVMIEIPDDIGKLKKLKKLKIQGEFWQVSSSIFSLKNLEYLELYLNNSDLVEIPDEISNLKKLKELILQTPTAKFPSSIYTLKSLEKLYLYETNITVLPEGIGDLDHLKELYLVDTKLKELPENIGELRSLKALYLPRSLEKLPKSISDLENLENLDMSRTKFKTLPKVISKLVNLEILDLPLSLEILPDHIGNLINVKKLSLVGIELKELPNGIGNMVNLANLDLPESLEALPESIENLKNLEYLDLSFTAFKTLPEVVTKLRNLSRLDLPQSLEVLPESIGNLINLETLYVHDDTKKLGNLSYIGKLKNLKEFYFTLHKGANYTANLAKLTELQALCPNCIFYVYNENYKRINIKRK